MVPERGRRREPRPLVREGPLRLGLRHAPRPRLEADDPRDDRRPVARGLLGRGDRLRGVRASGASRRRVRPRRASAASRRRAARTRRRYLVQKLVRAAFGNNNVDTCARVCHSPTGYGLKTTLGESAGTQDFDSVLESDVIVVIGANPTDAHPVFASQMKRRLREGAKLIVVDPRTIDLVRTPARRGDVPPAAAPGHERRGRERARARDRDRGPRTRRTTSRARCEGPAYDRVEGVHRRPEELARGARGGHRRARGADPRRRAPLRERAQRRHLLRPRRHRAQPGLDDGDRHREPRDGDRQPRPRAASA